MLLGDVAEHDGRAWEPSKSTCWVVPDSSRRIVPSGRSTRYSAAVVADLVRHRRRHTRGDLRAILERHEVEQAAPDDVVEPLVAQRFEDRRVRPDDVSATMDQHALGQPLEELPQLVP